MTYTKEYTGNDLTGRPYVITEDTVNDILSRIANGDTERQVIRDIKEPSWSTWSVFKSIQIKKAATEGDIDAIAFLDRYKQAREALHNHWAEEIIQQSYAEQRDTPLPNGKGGYTSNNTAVLRDRLKADSLKWVLARLMPDKWGDKVSHGLPEATAIIPSISISIGREEDKKGEGAIDVTPIKVLPNKE